MINKIAFFLVPISVILLQSVNCENEENEESVDQYIISNNTRLSEDGRLSFRGLAAKCGHFAEQRFVITEDGYNLTLYHIKGDIERVVLLVHGNTAASNCWVLRGEISLAITLANQGYDVWAINLRGSTESRRHLSIDPDKEPRRFFNYSFYEQGIYDIPSTVDYILKDTGQKQLLAVGHSVGTTVFYVMGAEKPEYNEKIKAMISLAPICFLKHLRGLAVLGEKLGRELIGIVEGIGIYELLGKKQLAARFFQTFCLGSDGYETCVKGIIFQLFGPDKKGFEEEFTTTFFGHFPEGTSTKLFSHLVQVYKNDRFAKYDYGEEGNVRAYNDTEPPEFDLSKVNMKIALLVGKEDYLSSIKDTERLSNMLPNVVHHQVLPYEKFNHADFVWGKNMPDDLYPYLLDLIKKYS